jgi:hypothetical protein
MRKALIGILLATATIAAPGLVAPAVAQDADSSQVIERYQRIGERNAARSERRMERRIERQQSPQRFERAPMHVERQRVDSHVGASGGGDVMIERYRRLGERNQRRYGGGVEQDHHGGASAQHVDGGHAGSGNEHRQVHREYRREHRDLHRSNPTRREHREFHRDVERDHVRVHRRTHRDVHRDIRSEHDELHRSNPTRREHRVFHREANRDHNRYHRQWDTGWRNDGRYDWQRYRTYNRSIFSPGIYYSPFRSHRYSRFGIGYQLDPGFYSSRYWITDPWQYRLPQPYPGTRWVRYYDDVLLVDVFTGEVVDVIYNFFW